MTDGGKANNTGQQLERFLKHALESRGYAPYRGRKAGKEQLFAQRAGITGRHYAKQVSAGLTIYQTPRVVDFLVLNRERFPQGLIVECKWQQSSGSVDEKYPFLYLNILKTAVPTVILLDGGGHRPGARHWLLDRIGETGNKSLVGVWRMAAFQRHLNNGFLG